MLMTVFFNLNISVNMFYSTNEYIIYHITLHCRKILRFSYLAAIKVSCSFNNIQLLLVLLLSVKQSTNIDIKFNLDYGH